MSVLESFCEVPMAQKNKSDSYQYRIVEISVEPSILNDFSSSDGLGSQLNLSKHSEEFYDLKQKLIKEVIRVVKNNLTKRQFEVVTLRLEGKTQIQIAQELGIHQTTVHKIISGNIDYQNGKKRYGGAIKKLKKLCSKDIKIKKILEDLDDLKISYPDDDLILNYNTIFDIDDEDVK